MIPVLLRRLPGHLWTLPNTLLGLSCLPLALGGGGVKVVDGVVEIHGPAIRWLFARNPLVPGGIAALTLGHVVLGQDPLLLARTRRHERVHVAQYRRWGPLFIPAYLAVSLWLWCRGRDPYRDNCFEREAFDRCGDN